MGILRRELGRTLALLSMPVVLTGCQLLVAVGLCNTYCGEEPEPGFGIRITSPAPEASFDGTSITVEIELVANTTGTWIRLQAGAIAVVQYVEPEADHAELTITPAADSGPVQLIADAYYDEMLLSLGSESRLGIVWNAPWELDLGVGDGDALAGIVDVGIAPRWDASRFGHAELTIADVDFPDDDPGTPDITADVSALSDGPATLVATVERDDGERATITRSVQIANCAALIPSTDTIYAYTESGLALTAGSGSFDDKVTRHDLAAGTSGDSPWNIDGPITGIFVDDAGGFAYLAAQGPITPGLFRMSFTQLGDAPVELGSGELVLGMGLGSDGALYYATGTPYFSQLGEIRRVTVGTAPTRVDVGGVPGAYGIVVDADGSLLVAANDAIIRLTLTAGVETGRATVTTRANAVLTHLGLDSQGRLYATDRVAGELLRWPTTAGGTPEVLYSQPDWPTNPPAAITFVEAPPRCYGLLITRIGADDSHRLVDVGMVRGTP